MDLSLSLCFVVSLKRTRDTKGALETLSSSATGKGVRRVSAARWKRLLGSHRFQRAVLEKDLLLGISRPRSGGDAYPGLLPINSSLSETARWKRCVP